MAYQIYDSEKYLGFQSTNKNLEDLFKESFHALMKIICGQITIIETETQEIKITGTGIEDLFAKFYTHVLSDLTDHSLLYSKIKKFQFSKDFHELSVTVSGDKSEHYNFTNDIKKLDNVSISSDISGWTLDAKFNI